MEKTRFFNRIIFDADSIMKGIEMLNNVSKSTHENHFISLRIEFESESWKHDNLDEFLADYRKDFDHSNINLESGEYGIQISSKKYMLQTEITVKAPTRQEIERVLQVFESCSKDFYIEMTEEEERRKRPNIFIGHGHSQQWRDLKDHLHDKHHYNVNAYETGERAGHSIRDVLESMMDESSFALLVLTGEDAVEDHLRARQNVIHETGLFQGRLGFHRAIVLLEEGAEEFSNIEGITQIRFHKDNIKETFGEVLAVIKREFENND